MSQDIRRRNLCSCLTRCLAWDCSALQISLNAPPQSGKNPRRAGFALKIANGVYRQNASSRSAITVGMAAALIATVAPSVYSADLGVIEITAAETESQVSAVPFEIGDTPEGEFTGFREVIEKEDLQQAGGSLAEVIATESGVQFRQSGGLGSFSTISLRGSTAEQVNVYVDGILLNEAAGGGVNLSHIELLQADKVEVYRGTVPVQLGNSAIGGAVNITSARATDKPSVSLLAGFGSFGSGRFATSYTGPVNWLSGQRLVASFSHRQSENDFSFLNDNGTSFNADDDERQKRQNGQTQSTSGFVKTGHQLSGGARLEHALQLSQHRQGISDWRNTVFGSASLDTDSVQWRSTISNTAVSGQWSSLWGANFSVKNEIFDDSESSIGTGSQKIHSDTQVFGGRGYWEKLLDGQSLSFNLRVRSEALDSDDRLRVSNATIAERLRADLNGQWNKYFNDGYSLFSFSLLGNVVDDKYQIESNADARDDFSDSALMPQLGLNHVLGESFGGQWSLTANASRHNRVPSFFELFGSQGLFEGNAALQAETSDNLDVGIEWRSAAVKTYDAAVQFALFRSEKENLITRVFNARGVGRSENISRARINGLEMIGKIEFENRLSLQANLTLQDSENLSRISGFTGRQLPGESALDGSITAGWSNDKWKAEYEYRLSADRFYDSPNLLVAADQKVHSVRLSRHWKDWRLDVEVDNLTDQNFEDFNGFPKPGRAGFISFIYQP